MYDAPRITGQRELAAGLLVPSNERDSDAEIKHGVQPLSAYEAPAIRDERKLSGSTQFKSVDT